MNLSFDEICQRISPIAAQYGVERIYLFGSRARGDHNDLSDYDFLITLGEIKNMVQLGCFIDDLSKALDCDVDVVSDNSTDQDFVGIAKKEGVLIYDT